MVVFRSRYFPFILDRREVRAGRYEGFRPSLDRARKKGRLLVAQIRCSEHGDLVAAAETSKRLGDVGRAQGLDREASGGEPWSDIKIRLGKLPSVAAQKVDFPVFLRDKILKPLREVILKRARGEDERDYA